MKRLSVIIPAYNAARTIERCLASVVGQTRPAHEVIVVDDGSTDSTAAAAGRFGVKLLRHGRTLGAGAARDTGARAASGEILAFLDADCVAPPDWLERIAGHFEADPALCGVGGLYEYERSDSAVGLLCRLEGELSDSVRADPATNYPQGGNSAFRRDAWHAARSGRERQLFAGIAGGEDCFVWDEIGRHGKVKVVGDPKVVHLATDLRGYVRRHLYRGQSGIAMRSAPRAAGGAGPLRSCKEIADGDPPSLPDREKPNESADFWEGPRVADRLLSISSQPLRVYGGWSVLFSSGALALALASPVLGVRSWPAAAAAAALALAFHTALFRPFLAAARRVGCGASTLRQDIGLRLLLLVRHACWAAGAALALGRIGAERARLAARTAGAALHLMLPGKVSRLFLFITARCNAACPFCLNRDRRKAADDTAGGELTPDELGRIACSLGRLPYLTVTGGEPFLRDDLPEVVETFHRACGTLWVTLTTNGIRSDAILAQVRRILAELPGVLLTVQVSLDSVDESHDRWRRAPRAFEGVQRTLRGLGRLRESYGRLRVQIATVYDGFNAMHSREILDACRRDFAYDQHVFYLLREPGERWTDSVNSLLPGFVALTRESARRECAPAGLWRRAVETVSLLTTEDLGRSKAEHAYLYPCGAGEKFLTLYENGDVAACEIRGDAALGNVRRFGGDIRKLLRQPAARKFIRTAIRRQRCACDWPCALQQNMLASPRAWVRFARGLTGRRSGPSRT